MSIEDHEATKNYERISGVRYRDPDGEFIWHCGVRARADGDGEFTCPSCDTTITVQTDNGGVL
jgi:uncharacterized C2H2 Zn-finger protein